jgi:V/A-type H+-transporting ATPase subunit D
MAKENVIPTRQELMRLKNKRKSVKRGHKLLKDKRDNLVQIFMSNYRIALKMRGELEEKYGEIMKRYNFAMLNIDEEYLELLAKNPDTKIRIFSETKNVLGVNIPEMDVKVSGNFLNYSLAQTNHHLDVSLKNLRELLPDLVKLVELEFMVRRLATEIEKTRRRVNALEYVILPEIDQNVHYIQAKLAEDALQTTVRLMKMKVKITD